VHWKYTKVFGTEGIFSIVDDLRSDVPDHCLEQAENCPQQLLSEK
jgi:hypothetical protein